MNAVQDRQRAQPWYLQALRPTAEGLVTHGLAFAASWAWLNASSNPGDPTSPWAIVTPSVLAATTVLTAYSAGRITRANRTLIEGQQRTGPGRQARRLVEDLWDTSLEETLATMWRLATPVPIAVATLAAQWLLI